MSKCICPYCYVKMLFQTNKYKERRAIGRQEVNKLLLVIGRKDFLGQEEEPVEVKEEYQHLL